MGAVATLCGIVLHKDYTGEGTSHSAGGLDIFTGKFGLSDPQHNIQSCNVNANGDHVCGKQHLRSISLGGFIFFGILDLFQLFQFLI